MNDQQRGRTEYMFHIRKVGEDGWVEVTASTRWSENQEVDNGVAKVMMGNEVLTNGIGWMYAPKIDQK